MFGLGNTIQLASEACFLQPCMMTAKTDSETCIFSLLTQKKSSETHARLGLRGA
jgi:hypothetical protein